MVTSFFRLFHNVYLHCRTASKYDASVDIASMAVIVDPLDGDAEKFYLKYGFIALPDSGKMFIPMATVFGLFK